MAARFPAASRILLCSWCKKVVIDESGSVRKEYPLPDDCRVKDYESSGICKSCGSVLWAEARTLKKNPPVWIRDRVVWKQALLIARSAYQGKSARTLYAVAVQVYDNLGGKIRVRSKALGNPAGELAAVISLFREWHEFDPSTLLRVKVPGKWPTSFALLGRLVSVVYESDKWSGRKELYEHEFLGDPLLVSSEDGRLFILGGNYKVNNTGIVG